MEMTREDLLRHAQEADDDAVRWAEQGNDQFADIRARDAQILRRMACGVHRVQD